MKKLVSNSTGKFNALVSLLMAIVFFFQGCATIFHGSTEPITLVSEIQDTKIYMDDAYLGKGTVVVNVSKSKKPIFKGVKEGCADKSVAIIKSFDPTSLLGIFLDWGIVSMLMIDGLATGAIQRSSLGSYNVTPDCATSRM